MCVRYVPYFHKLRPHIDQNTISECTKSQTIEKTGISTTTVDVNHFGVDNSFKAMHYGQSSEQQ